MTKTELIKEIQWIIDGTDVGDSLSKIVQDIDRIIKKELILAIKENCDYKYGYVDFYNKDEACGYLYTVGDTKYFIDLKETYIKEVVEE